MSFWKKVVDFFTGGPTSIETSAVGTSGSPLEAAIWSAIKSRMAKGESFTPIDVVDDATSSTPGRTVKTITDGIAFVDAFFARGLFAPHGYTRTLTSTPSGQNWLYHPASSAPLVAMPAIVAQPALKASAPAIDPYDVGSLLTLTPAELRTRALKIVPWRTAWIGRTDVIPPESDERTALIDRGLELRGLLTRAQLVEIHRVGDEWLKHKDAPRLAQSRAAKNAEEAVAQLRAERARTKEEKRAASEARKKARAERIARRKREDIVYLGRGVSALLGDRRAHVEKLNALGLPVMASPADVATALGVTIPALRFLCFHAEAARRAHYVQFDVPKRSGGVRRLSAPMPRLAAAQQWVLEHVLEKLPVERPAHGFVPGRSTVTNAREHVGRDIVINLDLESFFPSITFPRVRGLFVGVGYSPAVATILALLCTESARTRAEYDGAKYDVATGPRALPQGACTSPAISNQIARKLDQRLRGLAVARGWTYTRYADDLTFSAPEGKRSEIARLIARIRHVVEEEGFRIQVKKGRVQRAGGRQTVTGIVVNETHKLGVPREDVRMLRAILHNAKKTGLAAQNRDAKPDFEAWLRGKIAYVQMIDRARGDALLRALDAL
ncbi:reverse transcriptase family protein [Sandaracinus amylolyticus]|uniref:RNA-directed DNA polymerase n=1 Tax=Sandaracinus amylolyticus TaxID=927083 RepID=A0A0F6W768_9BACT|nr:reverse transcriptase family protein [Sandaracinus amylolyticus]AKF09218.1 Retron-type RNA-directed DNA polymerase [Sandaracinus amylolyticus]